MGELGFWQVMYVGSSQSRAILREYEFFLPKTAKMKRVKGKKKKFSSGGESKQDRIKFDVLLTSYEMINLDTTILKALKWECLVHLLLFRETNIHFSVSVLLQ
jgi:chromodomain-helicase-DNA-binding protein 4